MGLWREWNMAESRLKNIEEITLKMDFREEYGKEEEWSKEVQEEFKLQWEIIQDKYKERI